MGSSSRYVLSLDLATSCGWAIGDETHMVQSGVVDLSYNKSHGHPGDRLQKFYDFLCDLHEKFHFQYIVYEQIKMGFHKGQAANSLYFELQGILKLFARQIRVTPLSRHAMTIKSRFTGSGKAKKEDIAAEAINRGWEGAKRTHSGELLNHDEADAIALLCIFSEELGRKFDILPVHKCTETDVETSF